jgi:high-affinity iron transporter
VQRPPSIPIGAVTAILLAAAVSALLALPAPAVAATPATPATPATTASAPSRAASPPPPGFRLGGDPARGRRLYANNCAACHGPAGDGRGEMAVALVPKPTDLTNAARMAKRSDWDLYRIIRDGGQVAGLSPSMAGYKPLLSDADLRSVAAFVRGLTKRPAPRR